jgi:hypothetical protein
VAAAGTGHRSRTLPRLDLLPRLEALEDPTAPAIFTVTNTLDSGTESLRQAILSSNASGDPGNTIQFAIDSGEQTIRPDQVTLTHRLVASQHKIVDAEIGRSYTR